MPEEEKVYSWNGRQGVSWREYVDLRFDENQRALEKSERDMDARLESMNEFRDTLRDQASRFVTRDEVKLCLKPIEDGIKDLSKAIRDLEINKATLAGKASQNAVIFLGAATLIGLIISIITFIMNLGGK